MDITTTKDAGRLTIALEGRLDTLTAPQLEETVRAELTPDVTEMALDFMKLEYLSSAGLRVILATQKNMAKQGGLVVRHVNETIMEVFEITGFTDILTIE